MSDQPFSADQQEYLKGFLSGVEARRAALGLPLAPVEAQGADPTDPQRQAQDQAIAAGGKLVAEEEAKRRKHPLDRWEEINRAASERRFPKGTDIFLTKYFGLFYVSPAQDSFMCRLRIPGGILASHQMHGVAAIADDLAGGYADITTRANLQLREIAAESAPEVLARLSEIGLTTRGSGADNVRNITASPTAGIDKQELIDTRPHARALHFHILNSRALYGLPRKFNVAFDGGGRVGVLEDTNDIAFAAVQVADGFGVAPGVYYRLGLGGITGHKDFARETDVIVPPAEATNVADAILRVFIAHGTRTDRARARLKYLLDAWGLPRFLDAVEAEGAALLRVDPRRDPAAPGPAKARPCRRARPEAARPVLHRRGHAARPAEQRSPARPRRHRGSARFGHATADGVAEPSGLATFPTNASTPRSRRSRRSACRRAHRRCAAASSPAPVHAGCKFAAGDTKRHAAALAEWLDARITIDSPINIHLTGCHHSCAQHFIADIGLLATKVERGEELVDGYDLHVGGGTGADARIGRLMHPKVPFEELPPMILVAPHGLAGGAGCERDVPCVVRAHEGAGAMNAISAPDAADPGERALQRPRNARG